MPTGSARGLRYRTAGNDRDSTALLEIVQHGGERWSSSRGGYERERDDLQETDGKRLYADKGAEGKGRSVG